jgi:hypothetical protein
MDGTGDVAPKTVAMPQEFVVVRKIVKIIKRRWPDGRRYWWLIVDGLSWPGYYDREDGHTVRVGDVVEMTVVVTRVGDKAYWGVKHLRRIGRPGR